MQVAHDLFYKGCCLLIYNYFFEILVEIPYYFTFIPVFN